LADASGWQRWFFIVLGIGFCIYILWEMSRLRPSEKMLACVYALILGGALGNLWGRMANGYVVDFILVHYQEHIFPAFNVADSALFCGVALWMILIFREHRAQE
jgi:signal peptidase II